MANHENIKPYQFDKLAASQQREIAQKGAAASAQAKREKKEMRDFAKLVFDELVKDKKSGAELPTRYAMVKRLVQKVLKEGDVSAFRELTKVAGEMPKDTTNDVVINVNYNGVTKEAQEAIDEL